MGTLKYEDNGSVTLRHKAARTWLGVLVFAVTALACFYGVGIIATNSTFSPAFQKYFFWIAIFWSLISSSLLSWVVKAFGGNKRDVVAALLSGLSIWLVVIQVRWGLCVDPIVDMLTWLLETDRTDTPSHPVKHG